MQFHPESVLTEYGHRMLVNFRNLTAQRARKTRTKSTASPLSAAAVPAPATPSRPARTVRPAHRLHTRRIATPVDARQAAFTRMYAASPRAFWLDSARVEEGRSRFSFFGDGSGPLGVRPVRRHERPLRVSSRPCWPARKVRASVFDYLKRQLANRRVDATGLPFDFTGGYVGYFGYETKADCGSPNRHRAETPDACWLFADRLIAVDHQEGFTHAVCVAEDTPQATRRPPTGSTAHSPSSPSSAPTRSRYRPLPCRRAGPRRRRTVARPRPVRLPRGHRGLRARTPRGHQLRDLVYERRPPAPTDAYDFYLGAAPR